MAASDEVNGVMAIVFGGLDVGRARLLIGAKTLNFV